jgi:phosphatidylglycerophosphate synthase
VRTVRQAALGGLVGLLGLLCVLTATTGLGPLGLLAGLGSGALTATLLVRGYERAGAAKFSPADYVTLVRAVAANAVAAVIVDATVRPIHVAALVGLSATALALDAIDGWVARRTGTASDLGARFDTEVDAYLIFVLSWYVGWSQGWSQGWWILLLGLARYAFVAARRVIPWLRATVPPSYWRKTVAALTGIALTAAASEVLPAAVALSLLGAALALLAESFVSETRWLWRHRPAPARTRPVARPVAAHASVS